MNKDLNKINRKLKEQIRKTDQAIKYMALFLVLVFLPVLAILSIVLITLNYK